MRLAEADGGRIRRLKEQSCSGLQRAKELDGSFDPSGNNHHDDVMTTQRRIALLSMSFQFGDQTVLDDFVQRGQVGAVYDVVACRRIKSHALLF